MSTKLPQERVLDSSQLRIVYPVSSGVTHKEVTESKWTPVVKAEELKTCSDEQKKYVGITSIEAERYRQSSAAVAMDDHVLPPPPAPPILTGLGGLLPPPPPPPKLTAFDALLPPPPPLPPLLVVSSEEDLIIKEPEDIGTGEDVSKILSQRADAQIRLSSNPHDYEAFQALKEADEKMTAWAATKNPPGKFTGTTGLSILSSDQLQPHDPRYNAWVKKDEDVDVQA